MPLVEVYKGTIAWRVGKKGLRRAHAGDVVDMPPEAVDRALRANPESVGPPGMAPDPVEPRDVSVAMQADAYMGMTKRELAAKAANLKVPDRASKREYAEALIAAGIPPG